MKRLARRPHLRVAAVALGGLLGWLNLSAADSAPTPSATPPAAPQRPVAPDAQNAKVAQAATAMPVGPVVRVGYDDIEVGAMVLYRVGPPPTPGVVSREPYQIRYELLELTRWEAVLARTTLSAAGQELARENFTVRRYSRAVAAPPATTAAPATVVHAVAGQRLDCQVVRQAWKENGLPRTMEWALCAQVPLTGLVYEKQNGACQLELLAFSRGGVEAAGRALAAASAAAVAQATAAAGEPAGPTPRNEPLPPDALLVDPVTGIITHPIPPLEPVLPDEPFPLEGQPDEPAH